MVSFTDFTDLRSVALTFSSKEKNIDVATFGGHVNLVLLLMHVITRQTDRVLY